MHAAEDQGHFRTDLATTSASRLVRQSRHASGQPSSMDLTRHCLSSCDRPIYLLSELLASHLPNLRQRQDKKSLGLRSLLPSQHRTEHVLASAGPSEMHRMDGVCITRGKCQSLASVWIQLHSLTPIATVHLPPRSCFLVGRLDRALSYSLPFAFVLECQVD